MANDGLRRRKGPEGGPRLQPERGRLPHRRPAPPGRENEEGLLQEGWGEVRSGGGGLGFAIYFSISFRPQIRAGGRGRGTQKDFRLQLPRIRSPNRRPAPGRKGSERVFYKNERGGGDPYGFLWEGL